MKKIFFLATALAGLFLAASCQQENLEPVVAGNTLTYTVQVPGALSTKAIGDEITGNYTLYYEVYRAAEVSNPEKGPAYEGSKPVESNGSVTVELEFVKDQSFVVLFWAQNPDLHMFNIDDLRKVQLVSPGLSNNEYAAVFAGSDTVNNCVSTANNNVTLVRPISQLNIATNDESLKYGSVGITLSTSTVTVSGLSKVYNVATQEVDTVSEFIYEEHEVPSGQTLTVAGVEYTYAAMNYIGFAPKTGATVDVTFTVTTSEGDVRHSVPNVPVKPNYRTNIIGNLLTETSDFNVTLDKEWNGEGNNEVITEGLVKNNEGVYEISTANGLAYASQKLFAQDGGSYVLTADVDMTGYTAVATKSGDKFWESASISHKTFSFDGKGYSISNLPGMFVRYTIWGDLTIKNLTLNNPKVAYDIEDKSDKGVGAFFGFCDAFNQILLENCHVKGGEIAGGHWTGGLIGYAAGHNAEGVLTIKNCSVKETTVTGKGSCGGIIGHANGGNGLVEMNTISVFSNTIKSTGTDTNKAGSVMGTVGSATVKVTNCSVIDNEVTSNGVSNTKLWGRQGSSTGVLYVDGVQVEDFGTFTPSTTVTVTNDAELAKVIEVKDVTTIKLATGTYSDNIVLTVAAEGNFQRDIKFEAVEGASPVIAGTVTLGYRNQGVAAAMWDGNVTFEGITFDHAEAAKHSISVGDVKSLTLKNCTIIGDGEYGIDSARGNATGTSKIEGCTFVNAAMQLLGNLATGLVIDGCTFNESRINVQAGNGVTVQNCTFNNTLKSVHIGDSFYCVRSNSTPITVKNTNINIDSELAEVAASQAKWGLLWNRGTTNWTLENVAVTMTDAALMQTELLVTI